MCGCADRRAAIVAGLEAIARGDSATALAEAERVMASLNTDAAAVRDAAQRAAAAAKARLAARRR